ncbi:MAG: phosphoribosylformylglycinamidine synthase subunit PurQ [Planctomycetota bacterium]|nr:phosphoribosylformylglycinamidine synthase subunit PurQ [Planctomycetota bacterium]
MPPRAIVIKAPGTNCDAEMVRGMTLAGASVELTLLDTLIAEPQRLRDVQLVGFAGGFSFGDDVASGRMFAVRVREKLYPALRDAAERGCLIIGACNGFQILVQCGLLPGPVSADAGAWPATPPRQALALTDNINARFVDRWVGIQPEPGSACVWTRGLTDAVAPELRADILQLPVAHGEGRLVAESPDILAALEKRGQVALRYADNFNGSEGAIAGICDPSGRIFGLMPHPERFLEWTRHPYWTRLPKTATSGDTPGLRIFKNAVSALA